MRNHVLARTSLSAALTLAFAVGLTAHAAAAETDQLLDTANALISKGQPKAALEVLQPYAAHPELSARGDSTILYLLADTQAFNAARDFADLAIAAHPKNAAVWLARAYAMRRAGRQGPALLSYQEVLKLEPTNRDALQGEVFTLRDMGNASFAYDRIQKHPELFETSQVEQLRHAKAVELYRMARADAGTPESKTLLKESLALMAQEDSMNRNQLSDLLVVLQEAGQASAAVQVYETKLAKQGVADWAVVPLASAYTQQGHLQTALDVLQAAHARLPANLDITYGLVYAYCDLQRFSQATSLIDATLAALPKASEERPFARQLQVQVRLWSGDIQGAREQLEKSRKAHPDHAGLGKDNANLLNRENHHEEARQQLHLLITSDPEDLEARTMLAESRRESEPDAVEAELKALAKTHPNDRRVSRALVDFQESKKGYLWLSTSTEADRDSSGLTYGASVTSPVLTSRGTRLLVEQSQSSSNLASGTVEQRQVAAGVSQPLAPDWTVQAEAVHNEGTSNNGVHLKLVGELMDVPVTAKVSTLDAEVPAKAVAQGITSRSASVQFSPVVFGLDTSLSFTGQRLSDGNVRDGVSVVVAGRTAPLQNLTGDWTLRLGADTASKTNVSYFSPASDEWSELEVGVRLPSWNAFGSQLLSLRPYAALGTFTQTQQSTLLTTNVGLGLTWTLTKNAIVNMDVHYLHRPYDGVYSTQTAGQLSLSTRLP